MAQHGFSCPRAVPAEQNFSILNGTRATLILLFSLEGEHDSDEDLHRLGRAPQYSDTWELPRLLSVKRTAKSSLVSSRNYSQLMISNSFIFFRYVWS